MRDTSPCRANTAKTEPKPQVPVLDYQKIHDEIYKLPTPDLLGYIPFRRHEPDAIVHCSEFPVTARCELGLPLPPESLRVSPDYGRTDADYAQVGKDNVAAMKSILAGHGFTFAAGSSVLDFGCSAGRMIRWLRPDAERCRVVGADIAAAAVHWCREHLGHPFAFVTTTMAPHLPFRDASFDLVYSGSVFTHIDDLADAWLAEVARVLKPGGLAYLSIHDEAAMAQLTGPYRDSHFAQFMAKRANYAKFCADDYRTFTIGRGSRSQVFHRRDHFTAIATPWFEVLGYHPGAYLYQTAVTLRAR